MQSQRTGAWTGSSQPCARTDREFEIRVAAESLPRTCGGLGGAQEEGGAAPTAISNFRPSLPEFQERPVKCFKNVRASEIALRFIVNR